MHSIVRTASAVDNGNNNTRIFPYDRSVNKFNSFLLNLRYRTHGKCFIVFMDALGRRLRRIAKLARARGIVY